MDSFTHGIHLQVYRTAAERAEGRISGTSLGGGIAEGEMAPLTPSSRAVKKPGGQRLLAEETE